MLHHLITYYWIHILKLERLNYIFYMFLTYMPNFMPISRNGNGSGSSRVFSYPDPTRGARPVARTRPVYGTGFFLGAQTRPSRAPRAPRAPFRDWAQFVAQPKKKKKVKIFFFLRSSPDFFFAIQACIFQIKKLSPNLFLPTFKPTYLNSSLDNVAQMPNHRLLIINQ